MDNNLWRVPVCGCVPGLWNTWPDICLYGRGMNFRSTNATSAKLRTCHRRIIGIFIPPSTAAQLPPQAKRPLEFTTLPPPHTPNRSRGLLGNLQCRPTCEASPPLPSILGVAALIVFGESALDQIDPVPALQCPFRSQPMAAPVAKHSLFAHVSSCHSRSMQPFGFVLVFDRCEVAHQSGSSHLHPAQKEGLSHPKRMQSSLTQYITQKTLPVNRLFKTK